MKSSYSTLLRSLHLMAYPLNFSCLKCKSICSSDELISTCEGRKGLIWAFSGLELRSKITDCSLLIVNVILCHMMVLLFSIPLDLPHAWMQAGVNEVPEGFMISAQTLILHHWVLSFWHSCILSLCIQLSLCLSMCLNYGHHTNEKSLISFFVTWGMFVASKPLIIVDRLIFCH